MRFSTFATLLGFYLHGCGHSRFLRKNSRCAQGVQNYLVQMRHYETAGRCMAPHNALRQFFKGRDFYAAAMLGDKAAVSIMAQHLEEFGLCGKKMACQG